MRTAVAAMPAKKPEASRGWGERSVVQISIAAASGRRRRPIESPVIRLKLIKKPARLQARNQCHPLPPGSPRRLQPKTAATNTRSGHARINLEPDATSIPGVASLERGGGGLRLTAGCSALARFRKFLPPLVPFDGEGICAPVPVPDGERLEGPVRAGAVGKLIEEAVALDDGGLLFSARLHINGDDIVGHDSQESPRRTDAFLVRVDAHKDCSGLTAREVVRTRSGSVVPGPTDCASCGRPGVQARLSDTEP